MSRSQRAHELLGHGRERPSLEVCEGDDRSRLDDRLAIATNAIGQRDLIVVDIAYADRYLELIHESGRFAKSHVELIDHRCHPDEIHAERGEKAQPRPLQIGHELRVVNDAIGVYVLEFYGDRNGQLAGKDSLHQSHHISLSSTSKYAYRHNTLTGANGVHHSCHYPSDPMFVREFRGKEHDLHFFIGVQQKFTLVIIKGNTHRFENSLFRTEGGAEPKSGVIEALIVFYLSICKEKRPRFSIGHTTILKAIDALCVHATTKDIHPPVVVTDPR